MSARWIDIAVVVVGVLVAAQACRSGSHRELAEGKTLLAEAVAAKGGDALSGLKDVTFKGKGRVNLGSNWAAAQVNLFDRVPETRRQEIQIGEKQMTLILSSGHLIAEREGARVPASREDEEKMKRIMWRDPTYVLIHAGEPASRLRVLPAVVEAGVRYDALQVTLADAQVVQLLLDPKTHLIAAILFSDDGKSQARVTLSDYREEGGIEFAHKFLQSEPASEMVYEIQVNTGLSPSLFSP